MGSTTRIAWTRSSFSPWIGCTRISPGCDHCYAEALDKRHRYGGETHWGHGVPRHRTSVHYWKQPGVWNRKARDHGKTWRVFPSLCDPFDNEVPEQWREDFWTLIRATPNLTWLLLTKRIGNVEKMVPAGFTAMNYPHVWIGASIVNQAEADRDIPKLLIVPAAKRFVSYEPALGPVDFRPFFMATVSTAYPKPVIDQIIVGGESSQGGAKARPFDIEWARSTVRQCKAAGVPCFVKQLGSRCIGRAARVGSLDGWQEIKVPFKDRAGADPAEWPEELRVQQFPTTTN